jgi:hypothetical protein
MLKISETFYTDDSKRWRAWLQANYTTARDIWLRYPKVKSGLPRISYNNDVVEEALCFGWIDSNLRSVDEQNSAQRFTPRKLGGSYSQPNIERLRRLRDQGKLLPAVKAQVADVLARPFVFSPDVITAIQTNKDAWHNYRQFSTSYQRIRVAYVNSARRRPEEFARRLNSFIPATAKNKQLGFGGIEAYY